MRNNSERLSRFTGLKWVYAFGTQDKTPQVVTAEVDTLSRQLHIPQTIASILWRRGYQSESAALRFLNPEIEHLCDPFLLPNMQLAVKRVVQALRDNEGIMIFGDYDVDGLTASALLFLVLTRLGANVSNYVPNRVLEGYGLSEEGFLEARRRNVSLVISVDCGITGFEEVAFARGLEIDCIITDHHEPPEQLPGAVAIVNPKLSGEKALGEELSGVGLAFKLAQALYRFLGQDEAELDEHLDLVALGTAADIVPLIGENRILTKYGLEQIARTSKPGLRSLAFVAGLMGKEISTGQIVFVLAPRINAVGRLGDAEKALKVLTTRDEHIAYEIARHLDQENRRRKEIDEATLNEALKLIEQNVRLKSEKAIVLASCGWHIGVIGIVAARLVERFYRPTVMITIEGGEGKGSARSIPEFHIHEALKECGDLLLRYGGHKFAAGLSIAPENIETFRQRFQQVSAAQLSDADLIPKLQIDAEIEFEQIDDRFVDLIERFAPFGPQNNRPVFITRQVEILGQPYLVGDQHLKFKVRKGAQVFDVIGFGLGSFLQHLKLHRGPVDLAYVTEYNEWNDNRRIQLRLKDIHFS